MPTTNVEVPGLGESVNEAVLIRWHKSDGERVAADEPLCELETEKANVDVPSPGAGILKRLKQEGATVKIGETIATIDSSGKPGTSPEKTPTKQTSAPSARDANKSGQGAGGARPAAPARIAPAQAQPARSATAVLEDFSPAVRHLLDEHKLDPSIIPTSGPGGRLTKEDVLRYLESKPDRETDDRADDVDLAPAAPIMAESKAPPGADAQGVRREKMSKIRKKIAERLVQSQQTTASLTTFNEVDLTRVIEIRKAYKEQFEKTHGVGLGFMSFFAKASVLALREFPRVNAFIDGDDIVYHDFVNLGIAVSTDRGLAVPVLRNAQAMSFAKIESEIKRLAAATRDGKLGLDELSGGTFTITNGGVFGSLFATPILNPPQSGILGMHKIQDRPVVVNGQIVVRPMMYVALTYDHRIVDGRESVSFLVRIKEYLEDPSRLMLEV